MSFIIPITLSTSPFLALSMTKNPTTYTSNLSGPRKFELAGSEKMLSQFRIPPFDGVTAAKDAYHYMLYAYYKVNRVVICVCVCVWQGREKEREPVLCETPRKPHLLTALAITTSGTGNISTHGLCKCMCRCVCVYVLCVGVG